MLTPSQHQALITALLSILALTLTSFLYIQLHNYNPKATQWNQLTLLSISLLIFAAASLIPLYFLEDRTDPQCRLLYHVVGSMCVATLGLAKLFFIWRAQQVIPSAGGLALFLQAFVIFHIAVFLFLFNNSLQTVVEPATRGHCHIIVDIHLVPAIAFLLPKLLEVIANVRFIAYVIASTQTMAQSASLYHSRAPRRLQVVTCTIMVISLIISVMMLVCLTGPLSLNADRSVIPPMAAVWQVWEVGATAWPTIIIRMWKCASGQTELGTMASRRRSTFTQSPDIVVQAFSSTNAVVYSNPRTSI